VKLLPVITKSAWFSGKAAFEIDLIDVSVIKIFAALFMIAVGRHADGIDNMVALRFQIYSVSAIIIFYLFLLKALRGKTLRVFKIGSVAAALLMLVLGFKKSAADVNFYEAAFKADSYNYPHNRLFLHQYNNMPDPKPEFYRNFIFPVFFDDRTIATWRKRNGSQWSGPVPVLTTSNVPDSEHNKDDIYPLVQLDVQTWGKTVLPSSVFLGITGDSNPGQFYVVALRQSNSSWMNLFSGKMGGKSFSSDIPRKLPKDLYAANLCWIEDGKPRSIPLSGKVVLGNL
jgi:hypothetical protein